MASRMGARTVKDATRFTSTIPHATSKAAAARTPKAPSRIPGETPEQRVKRLRLAHLAAQKAQVSGTDRFIDASRRFFDVAHRWTVGGIVAFTAVAMVVSVYSVWDMLSYNRSRRAEFKEIQRQFESDELGAARLAYIKGDATPEQVQLVEEANRLAEAQGTKLPPLLPPAEHRTHFEETFSKAASEKSVEKKEATGKGVLGMVSSLFGVKGSAEGGDASTTSASVVSDAAHAVEDATKEAQTKFDETVEEKPAAKKGWWPW